MGQVNIHQIKTVRIIVALDMMRYDLSQTNKFKVQQVTDAPAVFIFNEGNFIISISSSANDYFLLQNMIEGEIL